MKKLRSFSLSSLVRNKNSILIPLLVVILLIQSTVIFNAYRGNKFNLLQSFPILQMPTPTLTITQETVIKKTSLEKFYKELRQADNANDYEKLYEIVKPALGTWISKEEFISNEKNVDSKVIITSSETIIHGINVENNKGFVDRTIIDCYTKKCIGKDRKEHRTIKEFIYVNNAWNYLTDKNPSERALKAATYMFTNGANSDIEYLREHYAFGTNKNNVAIHFMAQDLDNNLQQLLSLEAFIEKSKTEASRPVFNYQPPAVNYQPPDINVQAPPVKNSVNCTSSRLGSYTYTNCY